MDRIPHSEGGSKGGALGIRREIKRVDRFMPRDLDALSQLYLKGNPGSMHKTGI